VSKSIDNKIRLGLSLTSHFQLFCTEISEPHHLRNQAQIFWRKSKHYML